MPWFRISSSSQPAPTPKMKRPPLRRSIEATSLAVVIGSRSTIRQIAVPMRIRSVAAAIIARLTKGSWMRLYSRGSSSGKAGWGVSRLTGTWVCSVTKTDSKPRSSHIRASSAGSTDSSVGK